MRTAGTGRVLSSLPVMMLLLAGMTQGQRSYVPIDQPQFLQVEPIEAVPLLGVGYHGSILAMRVLKATWHSGKGLRAGISGLDANGSLDIDFEGYPEGWSIAPVHVGYDIVFNPKKTAFFYGVVPACYVEGTFGALPLYAKLAVACDIDYYGVGTGIEVGCVDWNHQPAYNGHPASHNFVPAFYAALKLRLLDAAFRLPRRE